MQIVVWSHPFLASGSTLRTGKNQSNMQNCGWRAKRWMTTQMVFGEFMMLFTTLVNGYINIQGDPTGWNSQRYVQLKFSLCSSDITLYFSQNFVIILAYFVKNERRLDKQQVPWRCCHCIWNIFWYIEFLKNRTKSWGEGKREWGKLH